MLIDLPILNLHAGLHPDELIVEINTKNGVEEIIVDQSKVTGKNLRAWKIEQRDDANLVELPNETVRGQWRVWVAK